MHFSPTNSAVRFWAAWGHPDVPLPHHVGLPAAVTTEPQESSATASAGAGAANAAQLPSCCGWVTCFAEGFGNLCCFPSPSSTGLAKQESALVRHVDVILGRKVALLVKCSWPSPISLLASFFSSLPLHFLHCHPTFSLRCPTCIPRLPKNHSYLCHPSSFFNFPGYVGLSCNWSIPPYSQLVCP